MKNEILIPEHFPDLKEEDVKIADLRRDRYSQGRDVLAREFNDAIAARLVAERINKVKCEKCGKEFVAGTSVTDSIKCPECR
jgi:hypothetical protein